MALVEQRVLDKIEIVGRFKHVQIRNDNQIIDDQTNEVKSSANWHRRVLASNEDISSESAEVQAVCNAVWTDEVKAAYAAHLDSISL